MKFIHNREKGQFQLIEDNKEIGFIHYTEEADGILLADSTQVNSEYRGKGYAGQLLDKLAQYARQTGKKIKADCSYVDNAFQENSEKYQDIIEKRSDTDGPITEKCQLR